MLFSLDMLFSLVTTSLLFFFVWFLAFKLKALIGGWGAGLTWSTRQERPRPSSRRLRFLRAAQRTPWGRTLTYTMLPM